MARPVTLFTGQWADLPLTELAAKAGAWGFDGLELACWGDHFDVDAALADVINVATSNATRTVGLIDSNKFGRASLLTIARAEDLDAVVTDEGLGDELAEEYRAAGVLLEIARN